MNITEKQFATQVEDLLELYGWHWTHFRPAMLKDGKWRTAISGHMGFPDYVAVRGIRLLFIELKSDKGKLSPEQQEWLDKLEEAKVHFTNQPLIVKDGKATMDINKTRYSETPEVYVFRPMDFEKMTNILK
jgi:Holliday junction resolvase